MDHLNGPGMGPGIVAHLADIAAEQFDSLDQTAGAAGCHGRIRQREDDGRWRTRYLRCVDDGRLRAAIPMYTSRGRAWPDPAYDPGGWELPGEIRGGCPAGGAMLVGGCTDLRSGLHVDPSWRSPAQLRHLLVPIASLAAQQNRCLVFPYVFANAKDVLTEALRDTIAWAPLGREAHIRGVSGPAWEDNLRSRIRYVLRRDRRLIDAASLTTAVRAWHATEDDACHLIAHHNIKKSQRDHPEFVRMRYREWDQCASVKLVVFTVAAKSLRGVLTALVWQNELELCEIGLSGQEGPDRLAAYLDLVFHQPIRFAQSLGLCNIRAGLAAEAAKSSRGAVFENLHGGVLTAADTKRLGDNELLWQAADCAHRDRRVAFSR